MLKGVAMDKGQVLTLARGESRVHSSEVTGDQGAALASAGHAAPLDVSICSAVDSVVQALRDREASFMVEFRRVQAEAL